VVGYPGFMPFTDRVDYVAAMFANEGYAIAVERLLKLEVPPRAQWLRAISCELCRIASHLIAVGTMTMDIGAFTPMLHGVREREAINDLIEALCGARLTYNYHRIGGVAFDLPEGWRDRTLRFLDHFDRFLPEFDRLISFNEVFVRRLAGVAVISPALAKDYGLSGPNLRGSGVDFDLRRDLPYGAYPSLRFGVPLGKGFVGPVGDAFDRYYVRCLEMGESSRIVRQALETLPEGEITAKVPRRIKPEAGEALSRVESARGQMAYYVVSDGTEKAWRVRARTGSFTAMGIVEAISPGLMVADLVALIASLDVVAPEIDR
jgi:NADH-quinone oxidoreductase subunit D